MSCPPEILELVERFERNRDAYKSGNYNETQLRREFLDPLFTALGWDVDNKQGYAEAYKDVVHEETLRIGTAVKAPDYSFRIGGTRKFFVEAKKPSVNLKDEIPAAFQLRRYAWSAKLPLSILSDFEEFAVYDCRVKPDKTDKASVARTFYLTYREYESRWEEIAAIFSRDAVLKGSFDRYAESHKAKKGTAEVDAAFLKEIESWRELLAGNLALRNPELSNRELNSAVQNTIDRIIFLRIAEDRGLENYGRLMALLNGANVYARLFDLFSKADDRYNSGLFHFKKEKDRSAPDLLSEKLTLDDKPLKEMIRNLYYPDSPYEFSVLPADILGQVYEQFLGKVIRLTAGHRAVVEDKPEVKKAGGVYYTPTHIVDYIVKNTVGRLLEEARAPKEAARLTILDPACGSGSFLLGAFQYLLDWHLKWYEADNPEKWAKQKTPALYKDAKGNWRLTASEKKRILLNNIYGVDIDLQAVEVTKLSLLLKVLEGESEQTLNQQLKFHYEERILPDLSNNIKCGNSLIGPDFYEQELPIVDEEEQFRINVFDWQKEFKEIMQAGGFDAVIGNPPYVRQESLGQKFKEYAKSKYSSYAGTADLYVYFIEQSHRLLRENGFFSMICSNKFMRANYGKALRNFLVNDSKLLELIDFGELPIFQRVGTFPSIILTQNVKTKEQKFIYAQVKHLEFPSLAEEVLKIGETLDNKSISGDNWTLAKEEEINIFEKMKKFGIPLGEYVDGRIYRGVLTGLNEAFIIDVETRKRLIQEDPKSEEIIKPFVIGDDVRKYQINYKERYLIFTRRGINIKNYPAIENYLKQYKERLTPKPKDWKGSNWKGRKLGTYQWYEIQDTVDYYSEFENPKVIYPVIAKESRFAFDKAKFFSNDKTFFIPSDNFYLLGILNSKVSWCFLKRLCSVLGDPDKSGRLELRDVHLKQLPIRPINFSDPGDKARHDKMVALVEEMLALHKRLAEAKTGHEQEVLKRRIEATDERIDRLVYELYDLTEEEIKIVEAGNK